MIQGGLFKKKEAPERRRHLPEDGYGVNAAPEHDESNWLVSYADMMTLLCGFFIMMFSMATLDQEKFEKAKVELSKQFHGTYTAPDSKQMADFATQIINELGIQKEATVTYDPLGVAIAFESTVFFDTLSAQVRQEGQMVLKRVIDTIDQHQKAGKKQYKIVVEGHTDSRPIVGGLFPSNWELSGARASSVVRLFIERGFSPNYLAAIGYGDTRPQVESRRPDGTWDETALAKNRRVVLRILEPSVQSIPFPK